MNVFLDDTGSPAGRRRILDDTFYLIVFAGNLDAVASVGVLARLDNPNVLGRSWRLIILRLFIVFFLILIWTTGGRGGTGEVIEVLHLILGLLCLFLLELGGCLFVFHILFVFEIIMLEAVELWVVQASLDVESQRYVLEDVLTEGLIVVLHVQEERLLIVHVEIVLDLVIQLRLSKFRNIYVI